MFCALKKFLLICTAVWMVLATSLSAENRVNAAGNDAAFQLAAVQMPEGTHEHSGNMPGMEEMSEHEHDGHEMANDPTKESSLHAEPNHDTNQAGVHEHQHDERTMGKPGEGPNWPLIEGFAFFNILVLIGAGFMKWKKKENIQ